MEAKTFRDPSPKAYAQISSGQSAFKTKTAQRAADVTWNETFSLIVHDGQGVILEVLHDGQYGPKSIGKAMLTNLNAGGSDQEVVLETDSGVHSGWLTLEITRDDVTETPRVQLTEKAMNERIINPAEGAASHGISGNAKMSSDPHSKWTHAGAIAKDYAGVGWEFTKTMLKRLPDFTDTNPVKATLEIVKIILELKEGMDDNLDAVERRIVSTTAQIQLMAGELAGWKPESTDKARWMDQFNKTLDDQCKKLYALRDQSKARSFLVQEADAGLIAEIFEGINEARMRFLVEVGIRTFKSVYDIGETLRKLFLDRLTVSRVADHKSGSYQKVMRRTACTPGTRVSSLDRIISWAKDTSTSSPNVFWLFGPAGSGKSTIAYTIARRFEFVGVQERSILLGGNFFCSRQSEETRDSLHIIPTIAYHLALISKPFADALHLFGDFESIHHDVESQIQGLLVTPWQEAKDTRTEEQHYLVVIDALDEIDGNGGSEFLQNLFNALNKSDLPGLKFFVTSRPDHDLVHQVNEYEQKTLFRLQDIEKAEVRDDVTLYLTIKLGGFAGSAVIGDLVKLSDGLFIHAATVVRYLEGCRPSEQKERIQRLLSNPDAATLKRSKTDSPLLDDLYHQILDHALQDMDDEFRGRRLEVLHGFLCTSGPTSATVVANLVCTAKDASIEDEAHRQSPSDRVGLYIDAAGDILEKLHAVLLTHCEAWTAVNT